MDKNSPWYAWHENSIGWLHRRVKHDEPVSSSDVARIIEHNADLIPDPILRDHVIRACRGKLAKKVGRPRRSRGREALIVVAGMFVHEKMHDGRDRRARGKIDTPRKQRGEPSASETAYEEVAREFRLGSGRSLANQVSSLKDWPYLED